MVDLGWSKRTVVVVGVFLALAPCLVALAQPTSEPKPRVVALDQSATEYKRLLGGPPDTVTMRSAYVVLQPTKSVGRHSTESYEEAVVVLHGVGEMRLPDGSVFSLRPYVVAYCPPNTEHDILNTGAEPLRYVYIVAKAQ